MSEQDPLAATTTQTRTSLLSTCAILFLLPILACSVYDLNCLAETGARARKIIAAVDRYHKDTGLYPENLDYLCPGYLGKIPGSGLSIAPEFSITRSERAPNESINDYLTSPQFRILSIKGQFLNSEIYRWKEDKSDLPGFDDRPLMKQTPFWQ